MTLHFTSTRVGAPTHARPRTLYVVDLENIVGKSEITEIEAATARRRIFAAVPSVSGDQTTIAVSHHNAQAAFFGWGASAQRVVRSGPDGADLALIDSMDDVERIALRFQRVIIASGDHAFAMKARALRHAGLTVTVICPDVGLSRALRREVAGNVVRLPKSPEPSQIRRARILPIVNLQPHLSANTDSTIDTKDAA